MMHGYYLLFIHIPVQFDFRWNQKRAFLSARLWENTSSKLRLRMTGSAALDPEISCLILQKAWYQLHQGVLLKAG